jgi:magnesium-transporting ATPase (P-type)
MPPENSADDSGRFAHALDVLEDGPHPRRSVPVAGNLILTSHAGLVILFFLVLLYFTGLEFTPLRGVHFGLGFALIPILLVKLGSTGWRAVNYYFDRDPYRAAGPPWLLPRIMALPLTACAIAATISGVVLWAEGTDRGTWATVHIYSVISLAVVVVVHLVIYTRKAFRASTRSLEQTKTTKQERVMVWALLVALVVGSAAVGLEPTWNPSATPASTSSTTHG